MPKFSLIIITKISLYLDMFILHHSLIHWIWLREIYLLTRWEINRVKLFIKLYFTPFRIAMIYKSDIILDSNSKRNGYWCRSALRYLYTFKCSPLSGILLPADASCVCVLLILQWHHTLPRIRHYLYILYLTCFGLPYACSNKNTPFWFVTVPDIYVESAFRAQRLHNPMENYFHPWPYWLWSELLRLSTS